jgi:hypothetical protein
MALSQGEMTLKVAIVTGIAAGVTLIVMLLWRSAARR